MKIPKIKLDVKKLWNTARVFEAEKRPQILAGMGVAGFWGAMWWTYKSAPKIKESIGYYRYQTEDGWEKVGDHDQKEAKKDLVIDICKYSAGPVLLGVASSAAVIGSTSISSQRIAALSAVCTATQSTLDAYREKIKEGVLGDRGEQKDQKVMNEIAKDRLAKTPITQETVIYETGNGSVLCLDKWTDTYFHSSPEAVKRAFNEVSRQLQLEAGDVLGWTLDHWNRGVIDISFTACVNAQEQPVLVLSYDTEVLPYYRDAKRVGAGE